MGSSLFLPPFPLGNCVCFPSLDVMVVALRDATFLLGLRVANLLMHPSTSRSCSTGICEQGSVRCILLEVGVEICCFCLDDGCFLGRVINCFGLLRWIGRFWFPSIQQVEWGLTVPLFFFFDIVAPLVSCCWKDQRLWNLMVMMVILDTMAREDGRVGWGREGRGRSRGHGRRRRQGECQSRGRGRCWQRGLCGRRNDGCCGHGGGCLDVCRVRVAVAVVRASDDVATRGSHGSDIGCVKVQSARVRVRE